MKYPYLIILTVYLLSGQLCAQPLTDSKDERQQVTIEQVYFRGNRRISEKALKALVSTRKGRAYDPAHLDRDIRALYDAGHFEDIKVFVEGGLRGGKIITFEVMDRPVIVNLALEGMDLVDQAKVVEEWRRYGLRMSEGSDYNPAEVKRAARVVKQVLVKEGHSEPAVRILVESVSPAEVKVIFRLKEIEVK